MPHSFPTRRFSDRAEQLVRPAVEDEKGVARAVAPFGELPVEAAPEGGAGGRVLRPGGLPRHEEIPAHAADFHPWLLIAAARRPDIDERRADEQPSELRSLMTRSSDAFIFKQ